VGSEAFDQLAGPRQLAVPVGRILLAAVGDRPGVAGPDVADLGVGQCATALGDGLLGHGFGHQQRAGHDLSPLLCGGVGLVHAAQVADQMRPAPGMIGVGQMLVGGVTLEPYWARPVTPAGAAPSLTWPHAHNTATI
jgi:hypothetical protein